MQLDHASVEAQPGMTVGDANMDATTPLSLKNGPEMEPNSVRPFGKISSSVIHDILHLSFDKSIGLDIRTTLWTCSKVCRSWRTLLVLNPAFWCNINIENIPPTTAVDQILDTILDRSGQKPLIICFSAHFIEKAGFLAKYVQLFRRLMTESTCWLEIALHVEQQMLEQLVNLPEGSMPILRKLSMPLVFLNCNFTSLACFQGVSGIQMSKVRSQGPPPPSAYLRRAARQTPLACFQLEVQLEAVSVCKLDTICALSLPCSQITLISAFSVSPKDALTFFQNTPNVVNCSLQVTHSESLTTTIRLSHLKRLQLSMTDNNLNPHIKHLDLINLPALEKIKILGGKKELHAVSSLRPLEEQMVRDPHVPPNYPVSISLHPFFLKTFNTSHISQIPPSFPISQISASDGNDSNTTPSPQPAFIEEPGPGSVFEVGSAEATFHAYVLVTSLYHV
ncbi:hypothetical protein C8J56DRAFT_1050675 [Mycena floridula]|nr:hypothetical protein C8J56DRAFT_1050675 [Mycena floridula]